MWFGTSPVLAQDYPTFDQRRDWLYSLVVPTDQISGSGKSGMPFAIAKLWQTNGTDTQSKNFVVQLAERLLYKDTEQTLRDWDSEVIFETQGPVRAIYQWSDQFTATDHNRIANGYWNKRTWGKNGTENHELMRWISGYLLAQKYGGYWYFTESDSSLMSATEMMGLLKANLLLRAEEVYRQDMAEYTSPNYLVHHLIPWLNLYDFVDDPELQYIAEAVITRHLATLALCNHHGAIIEPYARYANYQDLDPNSEATGNGTLLANWIYWGQINPTQYRIQQRGNGGPWLYYLAASDYRPPQRLVEVANGTVGLPCEIKLHSTQWHDTYYASANRRYIWRTADYAIGSGMRDFYPDSFYLQHAKFGMHWNSSDAKRSMMLGHAYWHADAPSWTDWLKATDSPFMQSIHHKDVAIILFNHPQADPWAGRGNSSDWWAERDEHANALRTTIYAVYPDTVSQMIAYNIGDDTRWYFIRENDIYIGIRVLTVTWTNTSSELGLRAILAQTQPNGDRYQSAFVIEMSTAVVDGNFDNFQNRLKANTLTVDWGTGNTPAQTVTYNNGLGITLTGQYDTDYNEGTYNNIWMHPQGTLNDSDYNWYSWPFLQSPYVSMGGKKLTIQQSGENLIYDLSYLPTP
ncbi:MAG: hypothetical protein CMJ19_07425 [Phycisphaeraceae bacterium]|nr:hypothetical protein [Phycisphaeraceae bacterium]